MARPRLLRVTEVAQALGVHPETIREWLRRGELAGCRPGGDKAGWRVSERDLAAYLARRRNAPPTGRAGAGLPGGGQPAGDAAADCAPRARLSTP